MIEIQSLKWDKGFEKIGIATFRVPTSGIVQVRVMQLNKAGERKFPGWYEMDSKKIKTYPTQMVGKWRTVEVYLVPLTHWDHMGVEVIKEPPKPIKQEPEQTTIFDIL